MEKEIKKETGLGEFYGRDKVRREEILGMTRAHVADLGRASCLILVGFISERDDEDVSAVFARFRACLELRIAPHNTFVVLDRVFELLQTGERVLRDRDVSKGKGKAKARAEDCQARELSPAEELTLVIIERLCDQFVFMESMVELVLSDSVTKTTMVDHSRDCRDSLKLIHKEVCSLKLIHKEVCSRRGDIRSSRDRSETPLQKVMKEKAGKLWETFQLYHI